MYRLELSYVARRAAARVGMERAENGASVVAASAYRSGEKLLDRRQGIVHDYRRKKRIGPSGIIVPLGEPSWARDRESLWNAVEAFERRKDARLAIEFIACIPIGLPEKQEQWLVKDLALAIASRHMLAVDWAIHGDHPRSWKGETKKVAGKHAHLLMPTRRLLRDGFERIKAREFFDRTQGPATLRHWRMRWALMGNAHLAQAGLEERWDWRSLRAQSRDAYEADDAERGLLLDRIPGVHLGRLATALERSGQPTALGQLNRWIEATNARCSAERFVAKSEAEMVALRDRLHELRQSGPSETESYSEMPETLCSDSRWPEFVRSFERETRFNPMLDSRGQLVALKVIASEFPLLLDTFEADGSTVSSMAEFYASRFSEDPEPTPNQPGLEARNRKVEAEDEAPLDSDDAERPGHL